MSKYTTEVRFICETLAGFDTSQGYGKVSDILDASWDKVFDFDFPIFDENYRSVLCKKILKHYYTREIGLETVGLWKLKLDTKMNEIMPLFNKRYESASFKFNPLWDVDYTRTSNGGESGSNNRELNGVSKNTESIDKNYEKILGENSEDKVVKDITVNDKKTGSDKVEKTGSEIGSKSGDDTTERTGTETGSKTGSDKIEKTGSEIESKSGNDTIERNGTETNSKTGNDTVEKTGTESKDRNDNSSSVKGGSNTRNKTGTENSSGNSDEISKKTGADTFETERDGTENNVDRYSDTPQGGLVGLRNDTYLTKAELIDKETHTEGTDRTTYNSGTTTSGTANNTVTYDTQDKEVIDTNESNISQGKEQSEINRTDETTYNSTDTKIVDTEDRTIYDSNNTTEYDTKDETTYNSMDTKVIDTEDKTIYNSSNTTEYDTKDETTYNSNREEKTTGSDTRNIDRNVNDSGNESSNLVNDGSRSENENSQFNTTKEYIEHIAGKMGGGSYAKAIIEYRDSLINVDMEVIEELGELFMRVW